MKNKEIKNFVIFYILFFIIWTLYVIFIYPIVADLGTTTFLYALGAIGFKFMIWVIPVFLFLKFVDKKNMFKYLKLNVFSKKALVFLFIAIVIDLLTFLPYGIPDLGKLNITWQSILDTSIMVGVMEEILFRGFVFQKITEFSNFWFGSILSSLLFLSVHFPGWITINNSISLWHCITVFAFGFFMTVLFKFTKSLWPEIIVHSLNDCFAVVFWRL